MKKRLTVLSLIGASLLSGCGKNPIKVNPDKAKYLVGVCQLVQHEALDAATKGFQDALYEQFSNIDIEVKDAGGESANCSIIANGFVTDGKDLILAVATPALQAAYSATESIPILGTFISRFPPRETVTEEAM